MGKERSIATLTIDSTVLCCNFVNTVSSWEIKSHYDYLNQYQDFLDWCRKLQLCTEEQIRLMETIAAGQPAEAIRVLERIREIRLLMQGFISSIARQDMEKTNFLLPAVNLLLIEAASRQRLLFRERNFTMEQMDVPGDLMSPVWQTIQSLGQLLINHDIHRIKECPKCGWVFLDETKNGRRKWCNPQYCGSTDKMMRYNQRKKDSRLSEQLINPNIT